MNFFFIILSSTFRRATVHTGIIEHFLDFSVYNIITTFEAPEYK